MKKILYLSALCLVFLLPGCSHQRSPRKANIVIVVIDGPRYQETFADPGRQYIPFMGKKLAANGAYFSDFKNDGQTNTNPGHASMVTGTWQNIANDGSERPDTPTLFEYLRKQTSIPKEKTWVVVGKSKLDVCAYSTHPEYGPTYGASVETGYSKDLDVFKALISHLEEDHPQLVLVNFADVDRRGHDGEWPVYIDALQLADSLTYEVWRFLQNDHYYRDNTYMFVTNDHGRHDDGHGGFMDHGCSCDGCRHIMCLVLGPDIKKDHVVDDTYTMLDICTTAGTILDTATPYSKGRVMKEMFMLPAEVPAH